VHRKKKLYKLKRLHASLYVQDTVKLSLSKILNFKKMNPVSNKFISLGSYSFLVIVMVSTLAVHAAMPR